MFAFKVGLETNAFAIISRVTRAMRRASIKKHELEAFMKEACAGNFDHLLKTVMKTVEVEIACRHAARRFRAMCPHRSHGRSPVFKRRGIDLGARRPGKQRLLRSGSRRLRTHRRRPGWSSHSVAARLPPSAIWPYCVSTGPTGATH